MYSLMAVEIVNTLVRASTVINSAEEAIATKQASGEQGPFRRQGAANLSGLEIIGGL